MYNLSESSSTKLIRSKDSPRRLSGLFAIVDEVNNNGRIYPEKIYSDAVNDILPKIRKRSLLGETDHPLNRDEIFLSNVSHVITDCHPGKTKSGKRAYYGTVELLDTPSGKVVQCLLEAGIPIGISSRGVGSVKKTPRGEEVDTFKLITYDLVAEPSFSSAILSEDTRSKLSDNLNLIESKLSINESNHIDNNIRDQIIRIRESLKLTQFKGNYKKTSDTNRGHSKLFESNLKLTKKVKNLKVSIENITSRFTNIQECYHKLQDSYNELVELHEHEMNKQKSLSESKILELQKRLAVEKRGMSYSNVSNLLEGSRTIEDIESKLESITTMNKRSTSLTENSLVDVKDSLIQDISPKNRLSKLISRV